MYHQSANLSQTEAQDLKILAVLAGKSGREFAGDILRTHIKKNRRKVATVKHGRDSNGGRDTATE